MATVKLVKLIRVGKSGIETMVEMPSKTAKHLLEFRKFEDEPNPNYSTFKKVKKVKEPEEEFFDDDGQPIYDKMDYKKLIKAYSEKFNVPGTGIKKTVLVEALKAGKIAES